MYQFEALALPAKNHRMIADRVAGPQSHHGYFLMWTHASDAFVPYT